MDALYSELDAFDYWRLCDQLTVAQAALLLIGKDPTDLQFSVRRTGKPPIGFAAVFAALTNAIDAGRLPAKLEPGEYGTDWYRTTIAVEDLTAWLQKRGINRGFFFPATEAGPDYLSKGHPNYSAKLAAALEAWKAVSADTELRRGKSVKQALIVWLRQHANEFGLTKEDGNPNEQGIEDVAKIANWDTRGGAPKTPGSE
jgi:hypothetical protein